MLALFRSKALGPSPVSHVEEIRTLADPERVEVLLEYPGHIHYLPDVKAGDRVSRNQSIGRSRLGNHVHASIDGSVEAIRTVWSPYSHHVPAVSIRSNGTSAGASPAAPGDGKPSEGNRPWLQQLKRSGVATPWTLPGLNYREVDLGEVPEIRTVVIKGVHEEPTVFTSQLLLREAADRVGEALERIAEIAPGATIWLTVARRDAKWAVETFGDRARIEVLPDEYRGRIERHVVPRLAGARIANTTAYRKHGIAVMPVEYLLALRDALADDSPFTRKCLTIAGDAIDRAVTVRIPLGASIRDVLEGQGISFDDVARVLVGGPMRGIAQFSDLTPLTHVDGLYLMSPDAVPAEANDPCINCGRCTRACPASIQVHLLNRFAESGLVDEARQYRPEACHECGLCAWVCPAQRSLVQLIRLCLPGAAEGR